MGAKYIHLRKQGTPIKYSQACFGDHQHIPKEGNQITAIKQCWANSTYQSAAIPVYKAGSVIQHYHLQPSVHTRMATSGKSKLKDEEGDVA
eukprot:1139184-Pelagomonas_calceolata.AAC.2